MGAYEDSLVSRPTTTFLSLLGLGMGMYYVGLFYYQVQLGGDLLVLAITLLGGFQHLPPGVNQLDAIFRSRVVICGNHGTLKEQFK